MSAQPVQEHDPDDPLEILRMLSDRSPSEYAAVAAAVRRPEGYQVPHAMLRLRRLTAVG